MNEKPTLQHKTPLRKTLSANIKKQREIAGLTLHTSE